MAISGAFGETLWVPLAKAQSIRAAQGPIQRPWGSRRVHLDAAGRHTRATLRDRAAPEAVYLLEKLPGWCATARGSRPGSCLTRRLMGHGAVAQLAEHLVCNQGVRGSNPLSSTCICAGQSLFLFWLLFGSVGFHRAGLSRGQLPVSAAGRSCRTGACVARSLRAEAIAWSRSAVACW